MQVWTGILGALAVMAFVATGTASAQTAGPATALIEAASTGDVKAVSDLVAAGAPVDVRDANGRTALLVAVHANEVEVARLLIEHGADVNAKDAIQDTPFLFAGAEGRNEILKSMLATGRASLKDRNRYGGTALIPAAHHGHTETVRLLLETAIDVDHVNDLGWTALLEAVILGDGGPIHQEIVGLLVDAGASNIPDRSGATPLDHARARGFAAMAARIGAGPKR